MDFVRNHWDPSWDGIMEWEEILREGHDLIVEWETLLRAGFEKLAFEGAPPPPPTFTLKSLLDTFVIDEEREQKAQIAYWNDSEDRAAAHDAAVSEKQEVDDTRAARDKPTSLEDEVVDAGLAVASAVASAAARITDTLKVPADLTHISDSATVFKSWHIRRFPATYDLPYELKLLDATQGQAPMSTDEQQSRDDSHDAEAWLLNDDGSIPAAIKKARSMIQPIPHGDKGVEKGQPAGTFAWTHYKPKDTWGWMYIEPKGDYSTWLNQRMKDEYAARIDAWKAAAIGPPPSVPAPGKSGPKGPDALLAEARVAAAVLAVMRQEGTPSAINTYDGTVLTWGIGIAGPGRLPEVFYRIMKDKNIQRAFYLCGFRYEGTPKDGAYQVVDLTRDPPVVSFRDNFSHKDRTFQKKDGSFATIKKSARDHAAYKTLQLVVDQMELMYLLVMVARDELTRETVFRVNYEIVEEMVRLGDHAYIGSEALFVFISEVKHNWDIRDNMVKWALDHRTTEEGLLTVPSEEHDRAIAKGVFRFVLRNVQRTAWRMAVRELEAHIAKAKKEKTLVDPVGLIGIVGQVTYGFDRLMENYWKPMQTGKNTQSKDTLPVPDFPGLSSRPLPRDTCIFSVVRKGTESLYDVGSLAQCEFLFPHNNMVLLGVDGAGNIAIQDGEPNGQIRTVTRAGAPVP